MHKKFKFSQRKETLARIIIYFWKFHDVPYNLREREMGEVKGRVGKEKKKGDGSSREEEGVEMPEMGRGCGGVGKKRGRRGGVTKGGGGSEGKVNLCFD